MNRTSADFSNGKRGTYVVQKHYARNLHFDFRLEIDGVMKSWAVPKGPPLTAEQKRLSIPTEDHALEFASFEGTIPEGQYGAGKIEIWDHGTYEVYGTRDAHHQFATGLIRFILHGNRLAGKFSLRKMSDRTKNGKDNWLWSKEPE